MSLAKVVSLLVAFAALPKVATRGRKSGNIAGGRARSIVLGAIIMVLLAACGSSSTPSAPSVAKTPTPPPPPAHGLLALTGACGGLEVLDPATGRELWSEKFHAFSEAQPVVSMTMCGVPSDDTRVPFPGTEAFSPDLTRVAAVTKTLSDGSTHVGWLDIATGKFTDVTAKVSPAGTNTRVPVDSNPLFDPRDGSFWFLRSTGEVVHVANGGKSSKVVARLIANATSGMPKFMLTSAGKLLVLASPVFPGAPYPVTGPSWTFNPDGSTAVSCEGGKMAITTSTAGVLDGQYKSTLATVDIGVNDAFADCYPQVWISNTTLLVDFTSMAHRGLTVKVTVHPGARSLTSVMLLNTSESNPCTSAAGGIFSLRNDFIPKPDGSAVAFIRLGGAQGNELCTVQTTAGSQPIPLRPTTDRLTLLEWR